MESWRIARELVYRDVPAGGDPPVITEEYIARARPVVDEQIQRGGVRLAAAMRPTSEPTVSLWQRPALRWHTCSTPIPRWSRSGKSCGAG